MSRFPLSGLARPSVVAAACAAAIAAGTGVATAAPANAHPAPRVGTFSTHVQNAQGPAMSCRLSTGPGTSGLQSWPAAVRARIAAEFGMTNIGGHRPGSGRSDHHTGHAIDVMVRGEKGTEIANWVRANAGRLNVKYVIWEQGYWQPGMSGYRPMEDRGGDTANHYDHVHISFKQGAGSCPS